MTLKIPKFGDPELLPKPKLERPSRRRMPFDASGRLKPEGPEFTEPPGVQPDIDGLPWKRLSFDSWTSEPQRAIIKNFIRQLLANNFPTFIAWEVIERNSSPRLGTLRPLNPFLIVRLTRKSDGQIFESSIDFPKNIRDDLVQFEARVALLGPGLLAQAL